MKTIIAFSVDKNSGIYASTGERCQAPPYLDFLLSFSSEDRILGFSHLDYDVANLLTMIDLTHKDLERLCDKERLIIPPYYIKYYKGKMFGIDKGFGEGHPYAIFSDLSQYDSELDHVEDRHDADYFFDKVKKAQKIGGEVYEILVSLGLSPNSLISPANAYKPKLEALYLPTLRDIPPEASELAYEACSGNWTEVFKRGYFPQVTDMDITSAYTFQASKLLDLRYGSWLHRSDYQPEATYGYCKCEVSIDSEFSPVAYEYRDKQSTPKGIFERSLNKGMIDFVNEYVGIATCIDGWWFFSNSKKRPLEKPIMELYAEKQKAEGLRKEIIKRVMNGSFYGGFIQTKGGEPAKNFCSPWACEIENETKIQVAKFVLDNNLLDRLISITVDGVVIEGNYKLGEIYERD